MQGPAAGHKNLQLLDARTQPLDTVLFWCWPLKPDAGRIKSSRLRKFATMTYEYQNSHDGTAHLAFLRGDRRLMPGWYARMSSTNLKMVFANWMSRACAELNRLAGHFKQRDTMYHQFDRRRWLGFIISSSTSTDVLKFASPTFGNTFAFEVAMSTTAV